MDPQARSVTRSPVPAALTHTAARLWVPTSSGLERRRQTQRFHPHTSFQMRPDPGGEDLLMLTFIQVTEHRTISKEWECYGQTKQSNDQTKTRRIMWLQIIITVPSLNSSSLSFSASSLAVVLRRFFFFFESNEKSDLCSPGRICNTKRISKATCSIMYVDALLWISGQIWMENWIQEEFDRRWCCLLKQAWSQQHPLEDKLLTCSWYATFHTFRVSFFFMDDHPFSSSGWTNAL